MFIRVQENIWLKIKLDLTSGFIHSCVLDVYNLYFTVLMTICYLFGMTFFLPPDILQETRLLRRVCLILSVSSVEDVAECDLGVKKAKGGLKLLLLL